ncbi:MAG: isoamylase early set domain-containing protein [Caldilineaceae bacterium]|nr:isoamylase early set domain-containing protein [Caldilineaceae bacterium]
MIAKTRATQAGYIRVIFELPACLWADRIYVVGDFNGWDQQRTPMRQDRSGVWRAELDLPGGQRFEFRYLVDNHWLTDSHSDGTTINPYGTQNSVLCTDWPLPILCPTRGETMARLTNSPKQPRLTTMD